MTNAKYKVMRAFGATRSVVLAERGMTATKKDELVRRCREFTQIQEAARSNRREVFTAFTKTGTDAFFEVNVATGNRHEYV